MPLNRCCLRAALCAALRGCAGCTSTRLVRGCWEGPPAAEALLLLLLLLLFLLHVLLLLTMPAEAQVQLLRLHGCTLVLDALRPPRPSATRTLPTSTLHRSCTPPAAAAPAGVQPAACGRGAPLAATELLVARAPCTWLHRHPGVAAAPAVALQPRWRCSSLLAAELADPPPARARLHATSKTRMTAARTGLGELGHQHLLGREAGDVDLQVGERQPLEVLHAALLPGTVHQSLRVVVPCSLAVSTAPLLAEPPSSGYCVLPRARPLTLFWSMMSEMTTSWPTSGPKLTWATRPISTDRLKGICASCLRRERNRKPSAQARARGHE